MSSFVGILSVVLLGIIGGLPTIFLTLSVPVVIGYKIYRKCRYGISLMN